jgi:hypothetical protein
MDSLIVSDFWREKLPTQEHELALSEIVLEARSAGIRRIQRRIFRNSDDIPRNIPISNYDELYKWCSFMFRLLDDDEKEIENERQILTIRYDKGISYRLEEEHKEKETPEFVFSLMKAISHGKPHKIEPDDDWIFVVWSGLADPNKMIQEVVVSLFVDSQPQTKKPHQKLLKDIIPMTWKAMRGLGEICRDEPQAKTSQQIRKNLDTVQRYCIKKIQHKEHKENKTLIQNPKKKTLRHEPTEIVVLFLASNPIAQKQLRLDEEVREISEMIKKSKHRKSVKLVSCWAIRPKDILQAINEYEPTIVHFSGHGSEQNELVLQDESGDTTFVNKKAIVQLMMASTKNIRLVFFNTCHSRYQAKEVTQYVEAAIGMNTTIGDKAARIFASQFYSAIGFGLSLKKAFEQSKALLMMENIPEENTPELFVSKRIKAEEILLVDPKANQ